MKNVYYWTSDSGIDYVVQINGQHIKSGKCSKLNELKLRYPECVYTYCEVENE